MAMVFDPEGPIEIDCGSASAIQESYGKKQQDDFDEGCFLVATTDKEDEQQSTSKETILGTAALIVGTQITCFKSKASISTPAVLTGAIRRVCCSATARDEEKESILSALLEEIERVATKVGVTELILLAYPPSSIMPTRPDARLLERVGYQALPTMLPGSRVIQYSKSLDNDDASDTSLAQSNLESPYTDAQSTASGSLVVDTSVFITLVGAVVVVFGFTMASLLGSEVLPSSSDNRGIGTPLSVQELERLQQEEQLQRASLDSVEQVPTRSWEDLGEEERREESALMRIIQWQDIRQR